MVEITAMIPSTVITSHKVNPEVLRIVIISSFNKSRAGPVFVADGSLHVKLAKIKKPPKTNKCPAEA